MGTHPIFESDFDCLTVQQIGQNDQRYHFTRYSQRQDPHPVPSYWSPYLPHPKEARYGPRSIQLVHQGQAPNRSRHRPRQALEGRQPSLPQWLPRGRRRQEDLQEISCEVLCTKLCDVSHHNKVWANHSLLYWMTTTVPILVILRVVTGMQPKGNTMFCYLMADFKLLLTMLMGNMGVMLLMSATQAKPITTLPPIMPL